jgi:HD-like signal output (HDOD) protein
MKISTVEIKLKSGKKFWKKFKLKSYFAEMLANQMGLEKHQVNFMDSS